MKLLRPVTIVIAVLLGGCTTKTEPLTSHGKPVAHWLEEMKSPNPKARKKAVVALGHVGNADPAAIPALIGALKDREATVRNETVLALLNLGPDAKEALPALAEAKNDKDAAVRSNAAKATERIQGTSQR
jgi:HEAT repeats